MTGNRDGLRAMLRPVRGRIAAGVVLQAIATIASLATFVAIHLLAVELLRPAVDPGAVRLVVALAAAALVVRLIAQAVGYQLMHDADIDFQLAVRRRVAAKLGRVPLGWFGARNSAAVKKALADDVEAVHYLVAHALPDLTAAVVMPVSALLLLVAFDWRLTLATLIGLPVFAVLFVATSRRGSRQGERMAGAVAGITRAVVEFVQGIAVIKAFGGRDRADSRFHRAIDDYMVAFSAVKGPILKLSATAYALVSPAAMLLSATAAGTVFVSLGLAEPIDVLPFVLLGLALTAPLVVITYGPQAFAATRSAADRVDEVLAAPELPEPSVSGVPSDGRVVFEHVTFGHQEGTPIVRDLGFVLEPGTVTALVGPSGAGKSTTAALLSRFFDPWEGSIQVGGVDLRDLDAATLYASVSFVFQDAGLLTTGIADNIRLGRPGATDNEVRAAAVAARCHDTIMGLPRGYDSVVGQDALLSGGEAQRVAIARALVADTPVLVLDEATAFVDPESEAAIYDALSALVAGRTVLFVAHRLHTVTEAEQILVLDAGTLVQRGTHAELLAEEGLYRRLWEAAGQPGLPAGGQR
ncbi:ABC transporter ATP-binding protein [Saccharothrix saharensis]|uniref:ABC transporter ATP-binding protein n=1 Tax=Saccharothrix saharensis TaxID=571190 RepID=UPI00369917AE